jgi:hypothetical protein
MRQTFHIFRKDARHCWPYTGAVAALTAANAWLGCQEMGTSHTVQADWAWNLLPFLVGVAWWFAASGVVHGEGLTGERQFWVTRPYSWKSLLAAKLLFLAAFVGLPMFLSDCIILLGSAFNPLALIPGLLVRQCWLAAFLVAPLLVSALTRTTRDLVLAGVVFYTVVLVALSLAARMLPQLRGMGNPERPWWVWDFAPWLVPVAGLWLVVWLYARRRTAGVLALAVTLALLAPFWAAPVLFRELAKPIARDDPRCRNVAIRVDPDPQPVPAHIDDGGSNVFIPVVFSGWPFKLATFGSVNAIMQERGRVTGFVMGHMTIDSDGRGWIALQFPEKLPAGRVNLSMSVEVSVYEWQGSANLRSDGGWTNVPGFGSFALRRYSNDWHSYPIARTALLRTTGRWLYRIGDGPANVITESIETVPASPLTFRFSPVYSSQGLGIGPGALPRPLVLSTARLVATVHRELNMSQIRLADYEIENR